MKGSPVRVRASASLFRCGIASFTVSSPFEPDVQLTYTRRDTSRLDHVRRRLMRQCLGFDKLVRVSACDGRNRITQSDRDLGQRLPFVDEKRSECVNGQVLHVEGGWVPVG